MAIPGAQFAQGANSQLYHMYRQLYPWKSKFEFASHLCKNILYNSNGLIAINKPYGVGLKTITEDDITAKKLGKNFQGKQIISTGGGAPYSIEDALLLLKAELKMPGLNVVKTGDKYNTGVMLLAENEKAGKKLHKQLLGAKNLKLFRYTYHIISPFKPYEGLNGSTYSEVVAIAQHQNPNQNFPQPVIVRDYGKNQVKRQDVLLASLNFSVKSTSPDDATLISIDCNDTKRNFLRVYAADMMMPILGDHLYCCRIAIIQGIATRVKPLHSVPGSSSQILPPKIKADLRLGLKEDTKIIPVHAHLHTFRIPHFFGSEKHLTVTAPQPEYFQWTCDRLKLSLPSTKLQV